MPGVSFILPTRNVRTTIGPLLEAIYSQEYSGDVEVLIMDSSDDETPELCKKFPVRLMRVEPEDYNYGGTRNKGAAVTRGEILVFLSTDIEIKDRKWLWKLTRHFKDPGVAGVFGRQLPKPNTTPMEQYFISSAYPASSRTSNPGDASARNGLILFSNNNSAIRRAVWERIPLPEMLKSEEQEWAKRAILGGGKIIYDAEAAVYHSHRYSLRGVFKEYFDSGATMPVLHAGRGFDFSMTGFIRNGLAFVIGEYRFMVRRGYWHWLPYALAYDFMKFSGVFLGSKQKYMPLWLKKSLCKKKNHWDTYSDVIKEAA